MEDISYRVGAGGESRGSEDFGDLLREEDGRRAPGPQGVSRILLGGSGVFLVTFETPDNVSQSAFSLAAYATGHLSSVKTTPLVTIEEGMEAMGKAGAIAYPPPAE